MPSEWHRLKQQGSVELSLGLERLPYLISTLPGAFIEEVAFITRGLDGSSGIQVSVDPDGALMTEPFVVGPDEAVKLRIGYSTNIEMATPFTLSVDPSAIQSLEDLVLVVKYAFPAEP